MRDQQEQLRIEHELVLEGRSTDPFSSAVRATRMPMLITDPSRDDNPIVFANAAFSQLTGFEADEVLGRNCRFLQGPETDQDGVQKLREAIASREPLELELLNYKKDGSTFWNRLLVSPVFDDEGQLTYFFASQFDVTLERERLVRLQREHEALQAQVGQRTSDLLAVEDRLRFALKAAQMGTWSLDLASGVMTSSEGCKSNFGRPVDEPFPYEELEAAVHPDDRVRRDEALRTAIETNGDFDCEYRIHTPDGDERWVAIRGQVFRRADGTPLMVTGVSQDITARKRAEEHRALLANELSHRVKNMLTTVQAIVTQSLRNASTFEDAGKTISARIQSMASANDLLVHDRWENAAIHDILDRTLAPFGLGDRDCFVIDGPELRVPPRIAVGLALALHELSTNAVKYGALSTPAGHVSIGWSVADGTRPDRLHFRWEEIGGPLVSEPTRVGFGSKLIQRVLASEIAGEVRLSYPSSGVVCSVVAPLPEPDHAGTGGTPETE